jgi:GABA permease
VYLVIAFSQLRMRRKLIAEGKEIRLQMWLFPWLTYLVIAFIVAALVTMAFMPDYQILVISTGIAAAVVVAMGVVHQMRTANKH